MKLWEQLEHLVAKDISGRLQSGSGNKAHSKGDCKSNLFLVECKSTEEETITFTKEWAEKIVREADNIGKIPAIAMCTRQADTYWVAIRLMDLPEAEANYILEIEPPTLELNKTTKFGLKECCLINIIDTWVLIPRTRFRQIVKEYIDA